MEKYLKKKRTMNESEKDYFSSEEKHIKFIKEIRDVHATNLILPKIIYTPKRSKEVTGLCQFRLNELCKNSLEMFKVHVFKDVKFFPKEYEGKQDVLSLLEINFEESEKDSDRVSFVKNHPEYFPVLSTIDFELLRSKMTTYVLKQPTITELAEEFKVSYNIMYRAIKFVLNFKYIKCSRLNVKSHSKLNDLQFLLFFKYFSEFMSQGKEFLFIDEASFNNSKRGGMKWVENGKNKFLLDQVRVSGVNLIICASRNDVVHYEILNKNIDSKTFCTFIDNLIIKLSDNLDTFNKYKAGKYVLVFDNASCHVSKETYNHMKNGKFNVLSLPPYSPYYNLVEYIFNWLKKKFYSMNFTKK